MDFRFTEEQQMTGDVMRELVSDHCTPADLRRLLQSGQARDEARWQKLVEMGLQGTLVPESRGGLGLAPVDFVQVAEACGTACLPEPLIDNAGIALPFLASLAGDALTAETLRRALDGGMTVALSHPANPFVADADTAGAIVIATPDEVRICAPDDVELVRQDSADPFRRLFAIESPAAPGAHVDAGPDLAAALTAALDRGALFAAAQLVGIGQRAIEMAVDYAKERRQFGKPIGTYQAVKHMLAEAQVAIEFARPVVHAAAAQSPRQDVQSRARISHAKLAAAEAADRACRTAIQVHGAMGYSWEVDVHFYLKRSLALSNWWGDRRLHADRIAERVFGAPLGPEHTFASDPDHG